MPAANRHPTARYSRALCLCCVRALHGTCSRKKWDVVQARLAGDGSSCGSRPASGNASTKHCWPNGVVVATSTSRVRSSTVHRLAPYRREKDRSESHRPAQARQQTPPHRRRARHHARGHPECSKPARHYPTGCAGRCHSTHPWKNGDARRTSRKSSKATGTTDTNRTGSACESEASHRCSQKSVRRTALDREKHVGPWSVRLPGFTRFDDSRFVTNATLMFTRPLWLCRAR